MKRLLVVLIPFYLMVNCGNRSNESFILFLEIPSYVELKKNKSISVSGYEAGKVCGLEISKKNDSIVVAELCFDENPMLSLDSKVTMWPDPKNDVLGLSFIKGSSLNSYQERDTIFTFWRDNFAHLPEDVDYILLLDSLLNKLNRKIYNYSKDSNSAPFVKIDLKGELEKLDSLSKIDSLLKIDSIM